MPVRAEWDPERHPHQQHYRPNNGENDTKRQHRRDQRAHAALGRDVLHEGQHDDHVRVERRDARDEHQGADDDEVHVHRAGELLVEVLGGEVPPRVLAVDDRVVRVRQPEGVHRRDVPPLARVRRLVGRRPRK